MLVATALAAGCASVAPPATPPETVAAADPTAVTVYLVYNHFHSGLAVPTHEIADRPGPTAEALRYLRPQPWTTLGYGDSKFYQQQGITPGRILDFFRFMLAPDNPSVIHLEGFYDPLKDASHPGLLKLVIPRARFGDLVRRVDASFALRDGAPQFVAQGRDANDDFFAGRRPASAVHECNQWIGEMLGAAGVPHTPVLDTTSDGLALDLVSSGRALRVGGQAAGS